MERIAFPKKFTSSELGGICDEISENKQKKTFLIVMEKKIDDEKLFINRQRFAMCEVNGELESRERKKFHFPQQDDVENVSFWRWKSVGWRRLHTSPSRLVGK